MDARLTNGIETINRTKQVSAGDRKRSALTPAKILPVRRREARKGEGRKKASKQGREKEGRKQASNEAVLH